MTCADCGAKGLTVAIWTGYAYFCRACAFIPDPKPKTGAKK